MTNNIVNPPAPRRQARHGVAISATLCHDLPMAQESSKRRMRPDEAIKRAREAGKVVRISGYGQGLYLACTPKGAASWRLDYRYRGRKDTYVFGALKHLKETEAAAACIEIKRHIANGIDPKSVVLNASALTSGITFAEVADAWVAQQSNTVPWSRQHHAKVQSVLRNYVLPTIGHRAIADLTVSEMRALLNGIPSRTQAPNAAQYCRSIFSNAVVDGLVTGNPVQIAREARALVVRKTDDRRVEHQPALIDVAEVRKVLLGVEASNCDLMLKLAHRFIALTAVRKMEALEARWSEVIKDGDKGWRWVIPSHRMKAGQAHEVMLSTQAREVLEAAEQWQRLTRVRSPFVFARRSGEGKPWGRNTMNELYNRVLPTLGYLPNLVEVTTREGTKLQRRHAHSVHGWRGSFSTIGSDNDLDDAHIERCLAHAVLGDTAKAYKQSKYRRPKGEIWQAWADLLTAGIPPARSLVNGDQEQPSNVVHLNREAA